jgi:hypothetical protein
MKRFSKVRIGNSLCAFHIIFIIFIIMKKIPSILQDSKMGSLLSLLLKFH